MLAILITEGVLLLTHTIDILPFIILAAVTVAVTIYNKIKVNRIVKILTNLAGSLIPSSKKTGD